MCTIIYESISDSTFNKIKGEATAALIWKKLISIMTGKSNLVREHLLTQLGNMSCSNEGNMQEHLGEMKILCERIEGMGLKIKDNQYMSMIQKSLPPSYNHICHTLSAASKFTGKPLTLEMLVAALHEEWDKEVASKATAENVAMSAQWQNKGKGQSSGGKSKKKPDRSHLKCTNLVCSKTSHLITDC